MKNELPANIRAFRKERGLTQEQLAEVFGVTVGAVHKWEAGLSTPDISLILEMADFFDTSLDVLIGFEARDNRISVLAERLRKPSRNIPITSPSCSNVHWHMQCMDLTRGRRNISGVPWIFLHSPYPLSHRIQILI